jgi:hypothetical protein
MRMSYTFICAKVSSVQEGGTDQMVSRPSCQKSAARVPRGGEDSVLVAVKRTEGFREGGGGAGREDTLNFGSLAGPRA